MTGTLADLVDLSVGYAFKSSGFTDEPDGIRLLRGDNVGQGRLRWESAKRWPAAGLQGLDRYLLAEGDVILAMDRPWIAGGLKQATVGPGDLPAALVQRVARLRARPGLDQGYLAAVVASQDFEGHILSVTTGSAVPHISGSQILAFRLRRLPVEEEQRGIATTLEALCDKIESNTRQFALIDGLLRTEFAQVSAQCPTRTALGDVATFAKGVSYRSSELSASGDTCLVTLKSVGRYGGYQPSGLKPYTGVPKTSQVLVPGELVVAQTDLTQAADVIGRVVRVPGDVTAGRLVASLDLVIVRPRERMPVEYLYGVLLEERFRQHCRSRSSGTTVLHLSRDALPQYAAPEVPFEEQVRFALLARPLLDKQDTLTRESAQLTALRHALLPELLSGRLRVPEASEAVGQAIA